MTERLGRLGTGRLSTEILVMERLEEDLLETGILGTQILGDLLSDSLDTLETSITGTDWRAERSPPDRHSIDLLLIDERARLQCIVGDFLGDAQLLGNRGGEDDRLVDLVGPMLNHSLDLLGGDLAGLIGLTYRRPVSPD